MKPPSFRLKIALFSAIISGVVLVAFSLAAFLLISKQKIESLDTEIRSIGTRQPGWITNRRDFKRLDEALGFIFGEDHRDQVILLVKNAADGNILYTSAGWPSDCDPAQLDCTLTADPKAPPAAVAPKEDGTASNGRGWGGKGRGLGPGSGAGIGPGNGAGSGASQTLFTMLPKFLTIRTGAGQWRLGMLGTADTTWIIGLNFAQSLDELARLRNAFWVALPLALFLVGFGGWLVAGRALRPMRMIASTAERVTSRGLDQRIPMTDEDPEIARVILMLNRMIDRLENSFQQATRFSADASHELKTPLAIMQGELENALQDACPGSREQQVFSGLLEEIHRLTTITRGLLLLSRADAGQLKPATENLDLTAMLNGLIEDIRVLAEPARLDCVVHLQPQLHVSADPVLLRTALLNLLINAVNYNEPGGKIQVTLEQLDPHVVLTLGNSGPGIPELDQSRIFTRFHRVDVARQRQVDGVGLGLSLAREIVRAHGGELELQKSKPGWTCFVLRLNA
jgi:heavy metal sensor kinase